MSEGKEGRQEMKPWRGFSKISLQ